ncbi:MAG: phosphoadenylyl-sulfate reductase [Spirochaetaceae bacterium]|jgi:phosphoadenosine phosphosulfate reductase|nr:phosphoadenylyl-sulfate reductase [Spirochaetaceae bacterium]
MVSEKDSDLFHRSEVFLSHVASSIKGGLCLAYSYQAEDTVVLDMLLKLGLSEFDVFTLDTKRLFPEMDVYHKKVEEFFGIDILRCYPDVDEEAELEAKLGEFGMWDSVESRKYCCDIRKVRPLSRFLQGKSAWFTGLRASQSETRADMRSLEYDDQFGLIKINPLVDWSEEAVFAYINERGLPLNPLYGNGFRSIGCSPCTRPVKAGEDVRAGRWWWEDPNQRECGCMVKYRQEHEQNAATIKLG